MNLYFEYPEGVVGRKFSNFGGKIPAKYCVRYNISADEDGDPILPVRLMYAAERIWKEDSTGIKFIKNRHGIAEHMLVDTKEFLWIKLSATEV